MLYIYIILSFSSFPSNLISPRTNSPITYDDVNNMDGKTLRDQIYTDWLQRKRSFTKEESKIRKEKQNKDAEDIERKKHERRVDVRKIYRIQDFCLLYTSPSPRDATLSRMPSSA